MTANRNLRPFIVPSPDPEPNVLEVVDNPQHRLDWAAYRVAERLAGKDPVLEAIFANVKNPLAEFLNRLLGPVPVSIKPHRPHQSRRPQGGNAA